MVRREIGLMGVKLAWRIVLGVWFAVTLAFVAIHVFVIPKLRRTLIIDGPDGSPTAFENRVHQLTSGMGIDLDAPILDQYVSYVVSAFHGDLGTSWWTGEPVGSMVAESAPWNVLLLVLGTIIGVGFLLLYARLQTWLTECGGRFTGRDAVGTYAIVPWYFVAFVGIMAFGYWFEILPVGGKSSAFHSGFWTISGAMEILRYALLPSAALGFGIVGYLAVAWGRQTDDALYSTATRRARVRGLTNAMVHRRHVLPRLADGWCWNGYTVTAWALGYTVLLEQIFSYRALGWYLFEGFAHADYPLILGCTIGLTVLALVAHAVVDLARSAVGLYDGAPLARSLDAGRR